MGANRFVVALKRPDVGGVESGVANAVVLLEVARMLRCAAA